MSTFASRLLECIEHCETSQAELARRANVSAASISDWARTVTSAENVKAEPFGAKESLSQSVRLAY